MTDNDIKKALKHCSADDTWCDDCPYENLCIDDDITKFALDLINRQQAEIERLTHNLEAMAQTMPNCTKAERTEAVKEFAERLKEYLDDFYHTNEDALLDMADTIDNLVKEMVGEGSAEYT